MNREQRQPWPGSWPPFWRGVLHVLVAAGVTNAVAATGVIFADPDGAVFRALPILWPLGIALLLSVPGLPVVIAALLANIPFHANAGIVRTFLLAQFIFAPAFFIFGLFAPYLVPWRFEIDKLLSVFLILPASTVVGCALTAAVLLLSGRAWNRRGMWRVLGIGVVLLLVAWASTFLLLRFEILRMFHTMGGVAGDFLDTVTVVNPFSLTFAITAVLLIDAVRVKPA